MRRIGVAAILLGLFCLPAGAQIGKSIIVPAGTPADKALYAITAAADPAQKISLINQFMSNYGSKPDMALLANILLTKACLDAKEYDKAMEAGDKVLASDPDNFSTAVNLVEAAAAKADASRAFDYGEKAAGIMARYKSSPPPAGMSREGWAGQQGDTLKAVQPDFEAMQYLLLKTASGVSDSATRAALLERFLKTFPDSAYAPNATVSLAFAYQQSQNVARMLEVSQAILAKDPSNVSILLLLADYYSSAGKQLEDATSDAQKVLGILSTAKKPAEMSDDAWMKQVDLQKGIANSALGQVAITRGRASEAAKYFEDANPLLQPNDFYYARNLYRLGFTLAKLERFPEARKYLEEAIKIDSPFRTLAQQTLDTVNGGGPAPRKSRHPLAPQPTYCAVAHRRTHRCSRAAWILWRQEHSEGCIVEVEMRRMLSLVGVLAVLFVGTQASAACVPQRSDSKADLSSFVGSWRGKFQGKKLIKLDLEIKDGKLTGNVSHAATIDVGDDGNLTNIADDLVDEPVRDAKMEGDSLHLWIGDSDDDVTEFLMTLTENNRAEVQLTNLPDGQTAPKPWEVHKAPPRDSQ